VSDNFSGFNGGGIAAEEAIVLDRSQLVDNSTSMNSAGAGGLIADDGKIDHSGIVGNNAGSCGGALFPAGSPTITDSLILANESFGAGGGLCIQAGSDLRITDSDIALNVADGNGGGMLLSDVAGTIKRTGITANDASGFGGGVSTSRADLTIARSTIANNDATGVATGTGGGLQVSEGDVRFVNSTIAANHAAAGAGGIYAANTSNVTNDVGTVSLDFTTIAFNDGDFDGMGSDIGGGIVEGMKADFERIRGSLIAENTAATDPDCAASVTSTGHNLIGVASVGCTGFDRPTDLVEPTPGLGMLGSHGGPTNTILLQSGSPAINAGGNKGPRVDQRGVARPQGSHYDIGSFERR
jgi:predicted outer membrane repeat protein